MPADNSISKDHKFSREMANVIARDAVHEKTNYSRSNMLQHHVLRTKYNMTDADVEELNRPLNSRIRPWVGATISREEAGGCVVLSDVTDLVDAKLNARRNDGDSESSDE